jgi:hypothetical protein
MKLKVGGYQRLHLNLAFSNINSIYIYLTTLSLIIKIDLPILFHNIQLIFDLIL